MREIEVKILEVEVASLKRKLESWGAKKVFEGELTASYYDFSNGKLGKGGLVLRLRKKSGTEQTVELTLKEKISQTEAKIMKEYEVAVTNFEAMQKILYGLGLRETKVARKHRISYQLDDVHFDLDTFPGIPTFLEIEAPTLEIVKEYVTKLGYSMAEAKPWSGGDLLRYYGKVSKR
ncbi:MAG: CYTH domain-containing protein [Nanoarchaeota archaeon]